MIRRTMNADFLNGCANHPEVRPWIGGVGELDLTATAHNPANICIQCGEGAWIFMPLTSGTYEVHTLFPPEARGKPYFWGAKEAVRYMFTETEATELVTKVPISNAAALGAAKLLGWKERFKRESAWEDGSSVSYRVFTIDDWSLSDKECLQRGQEFHAKLERVKGQSSHPEDETHDRMVGATFLMVRAGNMLKAVSAYNRWAIFAGYAPVQAISSKIMDIQDAIVALVDGEAEILLCRLGRPSELQF